MNNSKIHSNIQPKQLGPLEQRVIRAIHSLRDNAYGTTIALYIEENEGILDSTGAIYTTLERLKAGGLLDSWEGESTPQRGGRRKRFYRLTQKGILSLNLAIRMNQVKSEMLDGVPATLRF